MKHIPTILITVILTLAASYAVTNAAQAKSQTCLSENVIGHARDNIADWNVDNRTRLIEIRDTALSPSEIVDKLTLTIAGSDGILTETENIRDEINNPTGN